MFKKYIFCLQNKRNKNCYNNSNKEELKYSPMSEGYMYSRAEPRGITLKIIISKGLIVYELVKSYIIFA